MSITWSQAFSWRMQRHLLEDGPLTVADLGAAVTRKPAYRHLRRSSTTVPPRCSSPSVGKAT